MKTIFLLAVALLIFGYGWVLAIDQDRAWKWHEKRMRGRGLSTDALERTEEWEVNMAWGGVISMGLGVLILLIALCNA